MTVTEILFGAMARLLVVGVLGAFLSITFWLSRAAVSCLAQALRRAVRIEPGRTVTRAGTISIWIALSLAVPLKGCELMQVELYRDNIPAQLEIESLVYHDERSGTWENCGAGVFSLSRKTLDGIDGQGIGFFEAATMGRDGKRPLDPWKRTPVGGFRAGILQDRTAALLRGENCLSDPPPVWKRIRSALHEEGTFYTTGREMDLVVVPSLGLVVFSYDGRI